ncbi:MAG: hypothetical protein LBV71_08340 [Prevotella sp.]|jgi:hypothetical protein|nr:hypothetical protein [Prevotella sp.]
MNRKDIQIQRMQCATIINSPGNFISYDHRAGEAIRPIQCITSFCPPEELMKDILATKIAGITAMDGQEKDGYASFMLVLQPLFGYTNQKFEDMLCEFFEKYNL